MIHLTRTDRSDPLYWPCARCGALNGYGCRTITDNTCSPHADRIYSVYLWARYGRTPAVQAGLSTIPGGVR